MGLLRVAGPERVKIGALAGCFHHPPKPPAGPERVKIGTLAGCIPPGLRGPGRAPAGEKQGVLDLAAVRG